MTQYHTPVLLEESIRALCIKPHGRYIDLTFGGGGHSRAILQKLEVGKGRLLSFDQDADAQEESIKLQNEFQESFIFQRANFRYFLQFAQIHDFLPADGILADLGVSSHQFDTDNRGFSFRLEGPLDMRMNQEDNTNAANILNTYSPEKLEYIFKNYGELVNYKKVVWQLCKYRAKSQFQSTSDLKISIQNLAPRGKEHKFFAQVYQALRIEVNQEIEVLKETLLDLSKALKPGGRAVILTYHSLEDKLVKQVFRHGSLSGEAPKDVYGNIDTPWKVITRKAIEPTKEEILKNNRARSARMRVAEKI